MPTASGENADISAAYRLSANGFLIKPREASKLELLAKGIKDFRLTHKPPGKNPRWKAVRAW